MTFCAPQHKTEYLTECLIEVVNNLWKLKITKFGSYSKLEYSVGKKYIKVKNIRMHRHDLTTDYGVFMFIDKETHRYKFLTLAGFYPHLAQAQVLLAQV